MLLWLLLLLLLKYWKIVWASQRLQRTLLFTKSFDEMDFLEGKKPISSDFIYSIFQQSIEFNQE